MAQLQAHSRAVLRPGEVDDALPAGLLFVVPQSRAAERDPGLRADAGHLDADQAGAALGALAVMHEMPIGRAAVDRLVLRHRRYHDPVLQPHVAQPKRREHRAAH